MALFEKCLYSEFFWSVFSSIWTEYESLPPYSAQMRENTEQENSEYRQFSRSVDWRIRLKSRWKNEIWLFKLVVIFGFLFFFFFLIYDFISKGNNNLIFSLQCFPNRTSKIKGACTHLTKTFFCHPVKQDTHQSEWIAWTELARKLHP